MNNQAIKEITVTFILLSQRNTKQEQGEMKMRTTLFILLKWKPHFIYGKKKIQQFNLKYRLDYDGLSLKNMKRTLQMKIVNIRLSPKVHAKLKSFWQVLLV